MEQVDNKCPIFKYLVTYGTHEFLTGELRGSVAYTVAQFLTFAMNANEALLQINDGVGSSFNQMWAEIVVGQEKLKITAHSEFQRDKAIELRLGDLLGIAAHHHCMFLRFHYNALPPLGVDTNYKKRLNQFYAVHDATKLVVVDRMLYHARGFEESLMQHLVKRYGPEPEPSIDIRFRDRLTAFYHHYNPSKVPEVYEILSSYIGAEEQLISALVAKYGPEPIILGSDAGSDDSFTYTNDSEKSDVDPHPLSVPLMPFITPLHDYELPGDDVADFASDVHFWDNFVNQMPESEDSLNGINCNQQLLQQFMRSYPVLFPHIVTATCPFKEQVFRGSNEFWEYVKARSEANTEEVQAAAPAHVIRCVSSLDVDTDAVLLTRREWQHLVDDWETAHNLERRVKVGSVAVDGDPSGMLKMPPRPPPVIPPPPPPVVEQKQIQTIATIETQTDELPAPSEPTPEPTEVSSREPTPVVEVPEITTPPKLRLAHVSGSALPVAWPVATLANSSPRRYGLDDDKHAPPTAGDDTMEPYLRAALLQAKSKVAPQTPNRTLETQTSGWVPPSVNPMLAGKTGPCPRKMVEEPPPPVLPQTRQVDTKREQSSGVQNPFLSTYATMPTMKVTKSPAPSATSSVAGKGWTQPLSASTGSDFMEILHGNNAHTSRIPHNPSHTPVRRNPNHHQHHHPSHPSPFNNHSSVGKNQPSRSGSGASRDRYWKAFLKEMQSLTKG
eukprot:TRINITY_DN21652_c0_g1_i1.p1 TRINITY_DN21652_c0_g1~~TRINITY_DN21652_c0_g1_i1.p1  ORF type:complete len:750 (+),score=130.99 TRINITY_DN21652_c0_g1_i1:75-2252(+)